MSQGIPGFLCLAALCVIGFRGKDPWIAAALAGAIVAQQFTVFTIPTALLLYAALACMSPVSDDQKDQSATDSQPADVQPIDLDKAVGAASSRLSKTTRIGTPMG